MRIKLSVKMLIVILAIFLVMSLIFAMAISGFRQNYTQALQGKVYVLTEAFKTDITDILTMGLPFNALFQADVFCKEMVETYDDIDYCMVVNRNGKVLYHNDDAMVGTVLNDEIGKKTYNSVEKKLIQLYTARDGRTYWDISVPLFTPDGMSHLGAARVGLPTTAISEKINAMVYKTSIMVGICLIFTILLVYFIVQRSIIKNITLLSKAMSAAGGGDLSHTLKVKGKDEIAVMTSAFNKMVDDLSKIIISKDYVDRIVKTIADPLIVVDEGSRIVTVNQATLELLGYNEEELIGNSITAVFGKEFATFQRDAWKRLMSDGLIRNIDTAYRTKTGQTISVSISGSLVKDAKDHIVSMVFIAKDIGRHKLIEEERANLSKALEDSQRKISKHNQKFAAAQNEIKALTDKILKMDETLLKAKKQMQSTNEQLDKFVYVVSRELKENSNNIETFSKFILEDLREKLDDRAKSYLNQIRDSAGVIQTKISEAANKLAEIKDI